MAPAAGAHGELTGNLIMRKYFVDRGDIRHKMLIPDSAHGTNPASAAMGGFQVIEVNQIKGTVDLKLAELMDEDTVGLMLTNPNTVGLFDEGIEEIERLSTLKVAYSIMMELILMPHWESSSPEMPVSM